MVGVNSPAPYVGNIHQKPGDSYQRRACTITTRKQHRQPIFYARNQRREPLVIIDKLRHCPSLLGNDGNERLHSLCKLTAVATSDNFPPRSSQKNFRSTV